MFQLWVAQPVMNDLSDSTDFDALNWAFSDRFGLYNFDKDHHDPYPVLMH